jgi:hypothetical protein
MTAASASRPAGRRIQPGLPARPTSILVALPGKGKGKGTNTGRGPESPGPLLSKKEPSRGNPSIQGTRLLAAF